MAILSGVPGIQVAIQSFERDLPEYKDESEWTYEKFAHLPEAKRVSTYVECQTDAEFRIRLQVQHPYRMDCQSLTFKASVDGHGIAQATCTTNSFESNSRMYMEVISSRLDRVSAMSISSRSLKFSSIKKVDDHDSIRVKKDAKLVSRIGEIVVSVFRTRQLNTLPMPGIFAPSQYEPPKEVAEKALKGKAISHGVAYGEQQIIQRVGQETTDIDGPLHPIAVFYFKYRSRDDLKSELIIPRSPSPEFLNSDHRTGADFVSREARLAKLKREIAEIKSEDDDSPRRKKRGANAGISEVGKVYKTVQDRNGSLVIDLTDD